MSGKLQDVFLLWHINPNNDDEKLIGVYSTRENAQDAALSLQKQPGFKEYPECFEIDAHRIDMTSWTEGFVSL